MLVTGSVAHEDILAFPPPAAGCFWIPREAVPRLSPNPAAGASSTGKSGT
jgi:hypothetical protein